MIKNPKNTPPLRSLLEKYRQVVVEPVDGHSRIFCPTSRTPWFEGARLAVCMHPTESHCAIVLAPPPGSSAPGSARRLCLVPISQIRIAKTHRRLKPSPPNQEELAAIAEEINLSRQLTAKRPKTAPTLIPFPRTEEAEPSKAVA